ncbi:hypothetical protein [Oleiagrimonas sp. C23AA]|uniref:LpxL/LpxP family acyltransferase n=1 Tax=Oleiagrimonas sp. C23AA TaxID=2719047 RepID=UPI00141E2955|nr:hypothetical protein [Oleiagrimonas sp. C23AA]NII11001.1 hypothetical protein [Oleiagrimonas sp. C23AA]
MIDVQSYDAERNNLKLYVDNLYENLSDREVQDKDYLTFHYVDMNVYHFLGIADDLERHLLVKKILVEILTTRNIDHVPEFAADFAPHIQVVDANSILDDVSGRRLPILCGFHTGPYWSIFIELIRRSREIVAIFPPSLEAKKSQVREAYLAVRNRLRTQSSLDFIDLTDKAFLVKARNCVTQGKQLVLFLDGYGGYLPSTNERRDLLFPFLATELRIKTSIARLANALRIECVPFNAIRTNGLARKLIVGGSIKKNGSDRDVSETTISMFKWLEEYIRAEPSQWEGWIYFHTFLSGNSTEAANLEHGDTTTWRARFFKFKAGDEFYLTDKQTLKIYRINNLNGGRHGE